MARLGGDGFMTEVTRADFLRLAMAGALLPVLRGARAQHGGDLYVGHYIPLNFPDPATVRPGVLYAHLPAAEGDFSGQIFFPFDGCRAYNVGLLQGRRDAAGLSGTWRASADPGDPAAVFGTQGSQDIAPQAFSGKLDAPVQPGGCIGENLRDGAEWMLLRIGAVWYVDGETTFALTVRNGQVAWPAMENATYTYAALLDPANIGKPEQGEVIVWQRMGDAFDTVNFTNQRLTRGRDYIVSVLVVDEACDPLAQACTRFTWR